MPKLEAKVPSWEALARLSQSASTVSVLLLEAFEKALDGFFSLDAETCRSVVEAGALAAELIRGLNEESVRFLTESYPERIVSYRATSILRFSISQEQVVSHALSIMKRTKRLTRLLAEP